MNRYRSIWISDIHLGTPGCQAGYLLDFLRHNESDYLYLVGDIIDGWQLKRGWYWSQAHNDVVQKILRKARKGTRVTYIAGNHDEVVRQFLGLAFGGIIVVHGNAGDRAADRMRRGLILIGGDAGANCASRMLAGTILVSGRVGRMPGFALKRGTMLLARQPPELPATFQDSGEHALLFLTLLEGELRKESERFGRFLPLGNCVRRYCGDLANGGTGEILVAVRPPPCPLHR